MMFEPTADKLIPDLSPAEEIVLLARTLWREGYNDHLAGHITYNLGDGTLLCNPWLLTWAEIRPRDIIRIDLDGNVIDGDWPVPLGIPLHLELHRYRHDVQIAVHNHPEFGTIWADMGEIPPPYDQSSILGGGHLTVVDEYDGGVDNSVAAAKAVRAMGDADLALLAGHGVFVLARTIRGAHLRAVALERRCRNAWHVRAAGGPSNSAVPTWYLDRMRASDGSGFKGYWEASVRAELAADPGLLSGTGR
jgi:ribulose-5-phosphate 4-epimerase/fuculose-1-phosphate aldolase